MTFAEIRQQAVISWQALVESETPRIYINSAACGRSAGSLRVLKQFRLELERLNAAAELIEVGCFGGCALEPLVFIARRGALRIAYPRVTPDMVAGLVTDCIVGDNPRPDLALGTSGDGAVDGIPPLADLPPFAHQVRIASRNWGIIDPAAIGHAIANGGYSGLARALGMAPEAVIAEIEAAGLRGRGGAGFPTAKKWQICRDALADEKYLICNGAEGDPEARSIRLLLESDPHAVLEGVLIAAFAVGAGRAIVFVNGSSAEAIARLERAVQQAEELGLAGENILGSGFGCRIEVVAGGDCFVCGVETAMIRALEGERPMSYVRSPYPATAGLHGKPTCVNSAETLAHVSAILQNGGAWYAGIGSDNGTGTKLFTLSGQVAQPGVIEVPLGTALGRIVGEIGDGVSGGRELKGVLIGGPSGGCLPAGSLDLPLDYEHLAAAGAIMGSGRMTVAADDTCMVEMARGCLAFTKAESCGKCVLCREGSAQLLAVLTDITMGKGKHDDIVLLLELCEGMQSGSICALGRTAGNPVQSMLAHFNEEFEAHIKKKRCPALVCKKFITFHILGETCQGCGLCQGKCPEEAIAGDKGMIHVIDQDRCTKCGICLEACTAEYGAVTKAGGVKPRIPDEPVPVGSWRKR